MPLTRALTAGALGAAAAVALALPGAAAAQSPAVKIAPSKLGRILVDAHGRTLYLWAHDKGPRSTCDAGCATYWPPLVTTGRPQAGAGANAARLGTSRRGDGRTQITYHGHPLYRFAGDTRPGDVKGEGLTGFGGRWDPVSAAGRAVRTGANAARDYAPRRRSGSWCSPRAEPTAYAVAGTAPAHIATPGAGAISNVARVPFTIAP